jgi:signal transduction histidine kinase
MSAPGRPRYHRRQWIVNRDLQYPFVRLTILLLCLMAAAALVAVSVAMQLTLSTFELLDDIVVTSLFKMIFWMVVLELILVIPLAAWLGILWTHKVAGPLVRIHASLQRMTQGDFNIQLKLRQGDSLVELADAINQLAASLRGRSRAP